ncbi:hypothetical protein BEL04_04575 [Mucilaginibacter sp. PPCGB 2223]|uniref:phosphoribosylanthranilate isomerase n=1 Tax=Mucilaginibacter sp. PPCGB 2223 TaxID=1886027 RepID=UPI00082467DA|nr:phosphoribosylanthranilate isomerase [Mucilaginibacter sp. PPCGB 2223]OCX53574.1 hypothetical protein BEL04_04575 [Mucilaginibacter sp. PPCGB 2223]
MKIKVCGLKYPDNINAVAALEPDYVGFICYDQSPRFIDDLPADALTGLKPLKTGVFVSHGIDKIIEKVSEYDLDVLQLHGQESPVICDALKNKKPMIVTHIVDVVKNGRKVMKLSGETRKTVQLEKDVVVIKAFGLDDGFDFSQLDAYVGVVDYFLFDTKTSQHGGSGKKFNWDILEQYTLDVPFFLSGGLSLDNLAEVKKIKHPAFYGVDLNSRFETEPGLKDIGLLQKAFNLLRSTDTE